MMLTKGIRKVSIGIPTRNRSAFAIRAVESALSQTYKNIEVIISDNASHDDTVKAIEKIRDPRIILIKQATNIGMARNFNACLSNASGELFLMLSDDDVLESNAIEELSRPFFNPPDGIPAESIGLVWCPCMVLNAAGEVLYITDRGPELETVVQLITEVFNGRRGMRFCSVLIRTDDARVVGGYREDRYGVLCDSPNWGQAALRHEYAICVDRALTKYTIHTSSETSKSTCKDWQSWGNNIYADLVAAVRKQGEHDETRLQAAHTNLIANLTLTILMQAFGQPGWIRFFCREIYNSRKYLFTLFFGRRLIKEGWKILRLKRR